MDKILPIVNFIMAHGPDIVASLVAVLVALIALFLWVPGDQPEKTLQKIVDFLSRFSRKPQ